MFWANRGTQTTTSEQPATIARLSALEADVEELKQKTIGMLKRVTQRLAALDQHQERRDALPSQQTSFYSWDDPWAYGHGSNLGRQDIEAGRKGNEL